MSSSQEIPVSVESTSFGSCQTLQLREIEHRMEERLKRKEFEWNQTVEKMRDEFLQLYPCDQGSQAENNEARAADGNDARAVGDVKVIKKIGGGDVLDIKNLKTVFIETSPLSHSSFRSSDEEEGEEAELIQSTGKSKRKRHSRDAASSQGESSITNGCDGGGGGGGDESPNRKLHLRFDLTRFDPQTVRVVVDSTRITVQARRRVEEVGGGPKVERQFERKIQKPRSVDHTGIKAFLSADGVLVVEAPFDSRRHSSRSPREDRMSRSTSQTSHMSRKSNKSSQGSKSPPPHESSGASSRVKVGVPVFKTDNKGVRRLHMAIYLGPPFTPEDVIVQVVKENKIQIMAKHKVQTKERVFKSKFFREYELGGFIETQSLAGGLTPDGKVVIKALAKGYTEKGPIGK